MPVEPDRVRLLNDAPPGKEPRFVVYWSQMNRRVESNHALAWAAHIANTRGLPLLVYEAITCTYKEANDRLHTFMLEASPGTAQRLKATGAGYFFYLRARRTDPNDLLYRLAAMSYCVVTDDYPTFIAADNNASVPPKIGVRYIAVDSSCIVPMARHEKRNYAAYTIRPKIHRELPAFLKPVSIPKLTHAWHDKLLPPELLAVRTPVKEGDIPALVAGCDINHAVKPSQVFKGGYERARERLDLFLEQKLSRYATDSNQPSKHGTSELSPYLHFGQISSLEVALAVQEYADEHKLMADKFLEELIVRRELAFNFARFAPRVDTFETLPEWAKKTMAQHAADPRPFVYTPEQFERAQTHDDLWNACQKELLITGKIHGYYRMYWGKKMIEWSPTYEDALREMIRLHDIYAIDGRDPNTYTNILWCFGLHDRPWFERPVFGLLRYMSLDGMRRKTDTVGYMNQIAAL